MADDTTMMDTTIMDEPRLLFEDLAFVIMPIGNSPQEEQVSQSTGASCIPILTASRYEQIS
jgi:hypothetical protein